MAEYGKCHICETEGPLSREHVPPAKAFNEYPTLLNSLWTHPKGGELRYRTHKRPAGNLHYTLCQPCNNSTGGYYGEEYVRFAHTVAYFAKEENEGRSFNFIIHNAKPLKIFKQVLSMFCSTCGPGFAQANPVVPKLILNPHHREPLYPLRLYCYIRPKPEGVVSTGIFSSYKIQTGKFTMISEVSWWPVGCCLSMDMK